MSSPSSTDAPLAPAPSTAEIPLPPGMTLGQYETLQGQLVTVAITVAVAFALIGWDYVVLIRDELALYRSHSRQVWLTPATWAFIILRYSAFVATFSALWFTSLQTQFCEVAVIASQVGVVLVVASSGIIFCNRVVAIWGNSKIIIALVTVIYLGMLACWILVAAHYSAITGPPTPFGSNCQMQPIVSWAPISYASSVAFDVIVLILTMMKLKTGSLANSAISKQIYADNLLYFIATAVTNITVFTIQALPSRFDMIKPTAVPFSTVVTVTMAQRVYLNLKLFHHRQQRVQAGLPSNSSVLPGDSFNPKPQTAWIGAPIAERGRPDPWNDETVKPRWENAGGSPRYIPR
ncbi:hypothetical protein PUNSTDRAFT_143453 [Punctularia strigosozonata HHB-11173 SS5]|uniref:uncharacterized protein n=1 Tax=Punctularia strigosozonata (strain HHB-11173) TaxID=741275 RepID=UPI000441833D|nr:uncharacterized protein PUNSTDRAFT_143453 [Punctularia strigosozonata HHB-11173 SS5]EIN08715.1 hypothetical protein PUNSTDRAFT_143453 [Punctularia strigosozonata HHB-11173 SS5]